MLLDAGSDMRARLRVDLRTAMKEKRSTEAKVIRALIAAIDNAEAPPARAGKMAFVQHLFPSGSAEAERLLLSGSQVRDILLAEIRESERAVAEMERLGKIDRAVALRSEALFAKRYL